jgi:hypothetical protein
VILIAFLHFVTFLPCVVTMKNKFITSLMAAALTFSSMHGTDSSAQQSQWDNVATLVASWNDGFMGLPIDANINDTVIGLTLLDVQIDRSNGGNLDWGTHSPWIDLNLDISSGLMNEFSANWDLIQQAESALNKQYPNLSWAEIAEKPEGAALNELYNTNYQLGIKMNAERAGRIAPLLNALEAFYGERTSSYDCRLTVSMYGSIWRLESEGARWQTTRPENERAEKLAAYQQEMNAFGQFLKANLNQ